MALTPTYLQIYKSAAKPKTGEKPKSSIYLGSNDAGGVTRIEQVKPNELKDYRQYSWSVIENDAHGDTVLSAPSAEAYNKWVAALDKQVFLTVYAEENNLSLDADGDMYDENMNRVTTAADVMVFRDPPKAATMTTSAAEEGTNGKAPAAAASSSDGDDSDGDDDLSHEDTLHAEVVTTVGDGKTMDQLHLGVISPQQPPKRAEAHREGSDDNATGGRKASDGAGATDGGSGGGGVVLLQIGKSATTGEPVVTAVSTGEAAAAKAAPLQSIAAAVTGVAASSGAATPRLLAGDTSSAPSTGASAPVSSVSGAPALVPKPPSSSRRGSAAGQTAGAAASASSALPSKAPSPRPPPPGPPVNPSAAGSKAAST